MHASIQATRTVSARIRSLVFATRSDLAAPVLRVGLAAVLWPHGAQKLLGWFGGHGFDGTVGFFTQTLGLPAPVAWFTILAEFFGPILLLLGLGTRAVAAMFIGIMVGAIVTVHAGNGFFMNWSGAQPGEGFEYHILVIALALALVVRGGGSLSVDRSIARTELE
ncbi:MAG: DoxX family protein [Planctomycetes bacterium]|nr:DoxX family protein [Planctomycetota bacterium]